MKKIFLVLLMVFMLCGCSIYNKKIVDLTWSFEKAIINVGDETIEVDISTWNDFEDSDMVEIRSKDGKTYYTHSSNVVLISK